MALRDEPDVVCEGLPGRNPTALDSSYMQEVCHMLRKSRLTVLLLFIFWTGTSLVANASHNSSCPAGSTIIHLTAGDDNQSYGSGRQCVDAEAGNDTVTLGTGDDHAFGEEGNDRLEGREDQDVLWGGSGGDTVLGGDGSDPTMVGGFGNDTIKGEGADDSVIAGLGVDTLQGNAGTDTLIHCHDGQTDSISGFESHTHQDTNCSDSNMDG